MTDQVARNWKPAFHQPCDVCTMPCAWGHTGEGWTSYLCMNCYDAMVERLKMSRARAIGRLEGEAGRQDEVTASETWTPKDQPQAADVVPSITGDSGEVWIFSGVKVATLTDIDDAFAMRDKINQAGEQWLTAMGFQSTQDAQGSLSRTPAQPQEGERELLAKLDEITEQMCDSKYLQHCRCVYAIREIVTAARKEGR